MTRTLLCLTYIATLLVCSVACSSTDMETEGLVIEDEETPDSGTSPDSGDVPDANDRPDSGESGDTCVPHEPLEGEFNRYECDPFCQDCVVGQACVIGDNPAVGRITTCHQAGVARQGDWCAPHYDLHCAAGFSCNTFDTAQCRQLCGREPTSPQCPDGFECRIDPDKSVGACYSTTCTLGTNEGCGDGEACLVVDGVHECRTMGAGQTGDACTEDWDCALGMVCFDQDGLPPRCRPACFLTRPCPAGSGECSNFGRPGGDTVDPIGVCV